MVTCRTDYAHEFRVYQPHATSVELLGTFNGWDPSLAVELEPDEVEPGWWAAEASLPAGEHEFCYLVDGCTWLADYAAGGLRRNSDGRWISHISCSGEGRRDAAELATRERRELPGRNAEAKPREQASRRGERGVSDAGVGRRFSRT
ncbi:MAG: hypothetical protein AB7G11_04205 [Phycisphaerales bacterium]